MGGSREKISLLYAEDEPRARVVLERLIRHEFPDLTVYVAADGEEGMSIYREHHPQLVLTDITMPIIDGLEMSRRIRKIDPDAVIIAITAHNDAEWEERSRDLHFDKCIVKPVEFGPLVEAVGDLIHNLLGKHQERTRH